MPMIPRADAQAMARDAYVLDLGDLARQGQTMVERAHQEADRIVAEARAERQRLIADAEERGYEQGLARGHAEGLERGSREGFEKALLAEQATIQALTAAWDDALQRLEAMRRDLDAIAQRGVLELAVRLGERVAKRAVELDADAVAGQLAEAIELAMRPSRLRVRVCPEDVERAREAMPRFMDRLGESASVSVEADATLSHGSVVVETETTRIDATIETQISRLVEVLLPGGPR